MGLKLITIIIVDTGAKSSSTMVTAWPEVAWKLPSIHCKTAVVWNFGTSGADIVSTFGATMASLIPRIIRHPVGEFGLINILDTFFINVLEHLSFIINIVSIVCAIKHLIQHNQIREENRFVEMRSIWWRRMERT